MTVPLGDLTVDLVLYAVSAPDRSVRLVLRRTVLTPPGSAQEAVVEELWVSDPQPAPAVRPAVRAALGPTAAPLLLAAPVPVLPGLRPPTHRDLDELADPGAVAYLAGSRGTVAGAPGRRTLTAAEVVGGSGTAAHVARSQLRAVVAAQGLVADGGPGPDAGTPVAVALRTELLVDLADARTRLEQADLGLRLAAAPLGGWYPVGPELFRLVRLLPGPAALTAGPADPALDRIRVTFVEGTRIEGADATMLVRYSVAPGPDPRAALRGAAFTAYSAADPGVDPEHLAGLRQAAVAAVGGSPPGEPRAIPVGEPVPALHGTVVVHDDRALPVGNRVRRFATSVLVRAPGADAATLLQVRPEFVAAVVDLPGEVDDGFLDRLADAVCGPDRGPDPSDPATGLAALLGDPAGVGGA